MAAPICNMNARTGRSGRLNARRIVKAVDGTPFALVVPAFNIGISARILRFFLMFLGATFGLYGVFLLIIFIVVRLCSLQSFGVPYMSPTAPMRMGDQKDTLFRLPFPGMLRRPYSIKTANRVRLHRRN